MKCESNFSCLESGVKNVFQTDHLELKNFLECQKDDPGQCPHACFYGSVSYCDCPVRVYYALKYNN